MNYPENPEPLCVSFGLGVDSWAVLIGLWQRGICPDAILFSDTGGEKPETYAFLGRVRAWLASVGFPDVTIVAYKPKFAKYNTLEENCLVNGTLPSLAFGLKGCSLKFKGEVMNKWRNRWPMAMRAWEQGKKVRVAIGYDAGPKDSRRSNLKEDMKYTYWYPLREWGWDREECFRQIRAAGLPVPLKSSCFFCPAMKPVEVVHLAHKHPDLFQRALEIEENARARGGLKKIEGLWRKSTKGTRKGTEARPGSWVQFALDKGLVTRSATGALTYTQLDPLDCPELPEEKANCGCI